MIRNETVTSKLIPAFLFGIRALTPLPFLKSPSHYPFFSASSETSPPPSTHTPHKKKKIDEQSLTKKRM